AAGWTRSPGCLDGTATICPPLPCSAARVCRLRKPPNPASAQSKSAAAAILIFVSIMVVSTSFARAATCGEITPAVRAPRPMVNRHPTLTVAASSAAGTLADAACCASTAAIVPADTDTPGEASGQQGPAPRQPAGQRSFRHAEPLRGVLVRHASQ